jgi:tRNA 2-thiouridine synthesizing protein C
MNPRRMLFVVAHSPRRGALALETLDALLVGAAFDQKVSVLFVGDGVYQLVDVPPANDSQTRGYRALPTYDVDGVYVDRTALRQRGLSAAAFMIPVQELTRRRIQLLVAAHDVVIPD